MPGLPRLIAGSMTTEPVSFKGQTEATIGHVALQTHPCYLNHRSLSDINSNWSISFLLSQVVVLHFCTYFWLIWIQIQLKLKGGLTVGEGGGGAEG